MDTKSADIRWIQRFASFGKALEQLTKFIERENLNELEKQGLIKAFEYTFELAWNSIKDFYESQGETGIQGSRDAFRLAFKRGLIKNGDLWMDMIKSRVLTSNIYNQDIADSIADAVRNNYFNAFLDLKKRLAEIKSRSL